MEHTAIDQMVVEHGELSRHLIEAQQLSLLNNSDAAFRKSLALAAASRFEVQVTACIVSFVAARAKDDHLTTAFVKKQALERKYHTLFDWRATSAAKFFSLFGPEFKQAMDARVKQDKALDDAIRAFLELGNLRNELAHEDFASYPMNKSVSEVYDLYKRARVFVEALPDFLSKFEVPPQPGQESASAA
jgi:hypothetical protein